MPILLLVLVVIVIYVFSAYNKFQTTKTRLEAAIQEIGNQLKRQADLIPNLESSAKAFLKHEKEIFTKLTEARKAITAAVKDGIPQKMVDAASQLQALLPKLSLIVEDNPELRAQEPVKKLMEELRDTADKVMYARRTLIDLTADYNRMLLTVPSNLIGKIFNFQKQEGLKMPNSAEYLEVKAEDTQTPKVNLNKQ